MSVNRGTIVIVEPDPAEPFVGQEQAGERPCVVISDRSVEGSLRYDTVIAIVPITKHTDLGEFYPVIRRRPGGLSVDSRVLPEMLRVADKRRVKGRLGRVTAAELSAIEASLRKWLRLPETIV